MQNSLERLFEGIAHALHHDVLPRLKDSYARSQVTSAIEILGNLSTRVTWADHVDRDSLSTLATAVSDGADDDETREAILDALELELDRLRSGRFGRDT